MAGLRGGSDRDTRLGSSLSLAAFCYVIRVSVPIISVMISQEYAFKEPGPMHGTGATLQKGRSPFPVSHPFPPASLLHLPADFDPLLPTQSLQRLQFYDNVPPCFRAGEWGAESSACPPARSLTLMALARGQRLLAEAERESTVVAA